MFGAHGGNGNGNGKGNGHKASSNGWRSLWGVSRTPEPDLVPYRRLALQLHFDLSGPDNARSALVAAPADGGLCACASVSLAHCMGEQMRRPVLLIDACPQHPETSHLLDCAVNRGFTDVLADTSVSLERLALPTTSPLVSFLPAGSTKSAADRVPPDRLAAFLESAQRKYDFVMLAGGSVLQDPLSLALSSLVGCVLLIVVENETRIDELDVTQNTLRICGTHKIGLVWATSLKGGR